MSNNQSICEDLFFGKSELSIDKVQTVVKDGLQNSDDGELYLEYSQSESISLDSSQIKNASHKTSQGFGFRNVNGECVGYAHSNNLSDASLARCIDTVKSVSIGNSGTASFNTPNAIHDLYKPANPIELMPFDKKVELLGKIDLYARGKDSKVTQVMTSVAASWKAVGIVRPEGDFAYDIRPMVRMNVTVIMTDKNGRSEVGSYGCGGRYVFDSIVEECNWKKAVDKAVKQAEINLESIEAPAGEMPLVLGNGWCGVLLHEAVGHGLEGDFNRKKSSAFTDKIGQQVASKGVTVIDDGTIANRRGSLNIDDEGTPTQKTVLIEDGILKGYMQDRLNARLMGVNSTGNGRRESYESAPLPRMTNTYMLGGDKSPEEIIGSVDKGIYAVNFSGGQVDIVSGKFVFSASEAYLIEKGKITAPVKGVTLIGNGPEIMNRVSMIGNDWALDDGVGTCGKSGQGVPVGIGQPSLKIDHITIGGTKA